MPQTVPPTDTRQTSANTIINHFCFKNATYLRSISAPVACNTNRGNSIDTRFTVAQTAGRPHRPRRRPLSFSSGRDLRFVDVETGEIVIATHVQGPDQDIFGLQDKVAAKARESKTLVRDKLRPK